MGLSRGNGGRPASGENETATAAAPVAAEQESAELEKSVVVLSKLKEMEHYTRANIETLAGLMLTIEDELKQRNSSKASAKSMRRRMPLRQRSERSSRATKRSAKA